MVLTFAMLWALLPQLACFFPEAMMTSEEHQCCKRMAGDCYQATMTEHQCCRYAVRTETAMTAAIHRDSLSDFHITATPAAFENPAHLDLIENLRGFDVRPALHSPPSDTAHSSLVLRI